MVQIACVLHERLWPYLMAVTSAKEHLAFAFDIDGDQVWPLGRERLLQRGNDILRLADDCAGDAHTLGHSDKI